NQLLPASEAFKLTTSQTEQGELILNFQVANDYYLYKDKITVSLQQGSAKIGNLQLPDAIKTDDPVFGKVEVYTSNFQAILPISDVIGQTSLVITYQGCSATSGVCYPPEKKEVLLDPKLFGAGSATLSETDTITKALQDNSIWVVILTFFIFGLLLSLTPCVFPMIPILSSIIAGQGDKITTSKAFSMSLVYVLAMSITYTTAGVLAGIFGKNLQVMFQNPWIIASFAIIFVILAFSMFGFYELQLPSKLQTKITNTSNKQKSGSYTGVAVMGFLSALIVGPCVAPPLAGALIYIGQTGDAFLGGAALFAMSMGMGMILLIIGTSAGKFIPKAGVWMDNVKSFFGVTLLAVALWMADRILPDHISLILWAALLIGSGVYLGALNSTEGKSGWHKLFKTSGLLLLIYGVIVLVGASAGSNDLLKPLKVFQGSGSATTVQQEGLDFKKIKSIADVDAILATGQPVMLDFYADWCISCIEMEKFTFTDKNVQQSLVGITLLKADVTANDEIDKALMKKYGIIGPPAILFFVNGQEIKNQRVVGFKNAEDFIIHIQNSFKTLI
ncbi:MAG TPA: protein-disulfide reductase DsbD, partial [Thiomicrospira sp.]|nr:protein-disulfide reductase DsbD [Thiomicrospira sp.]